MLSFKQFVLAIGMSACLVASAGAQAAPATPEEVAAAASAADKSAQAAAKSATAAATAASAAASSAANAWNGPSAWLQYAIPGVVLIGSFMAILAIRGALKPGSWSIADALSEEVSLPAFSEVTDPATKVTTRAPILDKDGKPILVPEMRASSSRVIAFMGMIAILFMFIGFGSFALFSFGGTGQVPDSIDRVVHFLLAGLTLFAPYLVNKFTSIFQGLAGGK